MVEKHGLHKRIALKFLSFFEKNPKMFTFGIMLSCAFLSFIMPEHGVAAMFLPIVTSILIAMKIAPRKSNFGIVSMLSIAYGCSIGSLGTLIGGARNPLTVGMLADLEQPITVSFFDWMTYSMPIVFISLPIVWVILQISFPIKVKNIAAAKTEINRQVSKSGRMGRYEITVMCIMILTVFLWIFVSSPGYFSLAVIAILGSILLFFTGSITWKDVEQNNAWRWYAKNWCWGLDSSPTICCSRRQPISCYTWAYNSYCPAHKHYVKCWGSSNTTSHRRGYIN